VTAAIAVVIVANAAVIAAVIAVIAVIAVVIAANAAVIAAIGARIVRTAEAATEWKEGGGRGAKPRNRRAILAPERSKHRRRPDENPLPAGSKNTPGPEVNIRWAVQSLPL